VLNRLCVCAKHGHLLYVGGVHGRFMFCPACRADPEPALVSLLPRVLGTRLLCQRLAELVRGDAVLVERLIGSCRRHAGALQRPDPVALCDKRQQAERLTQQIKFVMSAPGDTEQDLAENQTVLADLRRQRAAVLADLQKLEAAAGREIRIPTIAEARALLDRLADILGAAAASTEEREVAAARRIVESLTGGRIVISQQGEAKAKRGWLRATFRAHLLGPALDELGVPAGGDDDDDDEGAEYHVDIRKQTPAESLADDAKALWDQDLLVKQIAEKLTESRGAPIGRAMVNKALRHWFESRGLPLQDGRSRRKMLATKSIDPNLPAQIADEVMSLSDHSLLYAEIAERLGVHIATVTAAVRHWHKVRGLPVPDGRSRRKDLTRKSREGPATQAATCT
jgi:hypothetical protein